VRDKKRIKRILEMIDKLWSKYPDQCFYQFMINNGLMKDDYKLWNLEDDELEKFLINTLKGGTKT
jgi:hypothetical protein